MTPRSRSLEHRYRWLSAGIVAAFSLTFAIGLVLYVLEPGGRAAAMALQLGLVLLMASPAVRMMVATAERVRLRDVAFIMMTIAVVVELGIVFWRAGG
jgi:hypothetical protein